MDSVTDTRDTEGNLEANMCFGMLIDATSYPFVLNFFWT